MVNLSRWRVNAALEVAVAERLGVYVVADRQASATAMGDKVGRATSAGLPTLVDFRWYSPLAAYPDWFSGWAGVSRADLESAEVLRREFFTLLAETYEGPLIAPSGPPNDMNRSMAYGREMIALRNTDHAGRPVYVSVALDRQGLQDPAVIGTLIPPKGTDGVVLTVLDVANYPSVWNEQEWLAWLRVVGSLRQSGYEVILPSADVRGPVAMGLCGAEYTTGTSQADRQVPRDPPGSGGSGATAPVSYFSAPLMVPMHGLNVAVDPVARRVCETHSTCGIYGRLEVPSATIGFDPQWSGTGDSVSDQTDERIRRHITDLLAVDRWIAAQANPVDAVEALLVHAEDAGASLSPDVFKTAGSRNELTSRRSAFQQARSTLGL